MQARTRTIHTRTIYTRTIHTLRLDMHAGSPTHTHTHTHTHKHRLIGFTHGTQPLHHFALQDLLRQAAIAQREQQRETETKDKERVMHTHTRTHARTHSLMYTYTHIHSFPVRQGVVTDKQMMLHTIRNKLKES